ncbi:MAG TPA: HAMP domain-containing sensor histidine kinase [Cytophagaceae bacterium]
MDEVLESFKHVPNYSLMKFNIQIDQQGDFYSDKYLIHSVIQNLVENPIKYIDLSKPEHILNVTIKTNVSGATLIFQDNGMGIPEKHQKKIFDMFYKVNDASNGSGLGLYLVKVAVDKLKGSIMLRSEVGKGSEFKVVIPARKQS